MTWSLLVQMTSNFNSIYRNDYIKCLNTFPPLTEYHFSIWKENEQNFKLFLHILLKFVIIWMRIGQIIRWWNDTCVCVMSWIWY